MKMRLVRLTVFFAAIMLLTAIYFNTSAQKAATQETGAQLAVALNEVVQLARAGEWDAVSDKSAQLSGSLRKSCGQAGRTDGMFLMCGIAVLYMVVVFVYVYMAILRPFDHMKQFAQKIAQGDLDVPLDYERSNYFGAFTWAFDSMRREITKARACEHEAIENNKTVIATLSHDIKTPIASIRVYAEGLEANLDTTAEKRQTYIRVLMRKCDEVSRLTNDLFLHSLADLDKLKITLERVELGGFLEAAAAELAAEKNDVRFQKPPFAAVAEADKNRLLQITENLINNSRKYAKSVIMIWMTEENGEIGIHFRDYGPGILDEDLPFIYDKFYRGKNCGREQGSGLGLYIVKYIAGQMRGSVFLKNHPDGLEAVVCLPKAGAAKD